MTWPYLLSLLTDAMEADAGAVTSANANRAGYWKRIALAAEDLAGASTLSNDNMAGYALRAAVALEDLANVSRTETGLAAYEMRAALALESLVGASSAGSWAQRAYTAALAYTGSSYSAEATAAFAAMSVQPDSTRKTLIDTLIVGLKSDGVWAKGDWLSLVAAHDAQAGRINLITPAQVATAVNSPTFTTDRGYTGDGATSYLNTGWNPTTAVSPKLTQNSASMGAWCGTDVGNNTQYDLGIANRMSINGRGTSATSHRANTQSATLDTSAAMSPASSVGFTSWSRYGAASAEMFKNGVSNVTKTSASAALLNASIFALAVNNNASIGNPVSYSTRRLQAIWWGGQLTAAEHLALYNRLAAYMTAIGA